MKKKIFLFITLTALLLLTACSRNTRSNSVFPNIEDGALPDILNKIVGTPGGSYFTSFGASDDTEYQTYFTATFHNTTASDYDELMEHYQSASTGVNENGYLLFDWGWLQVTSESDSISIHAFIQ